MAQLLSLPLARVQDANGAVYPGAKLYAYLTGTSTPTPTYTDDTLTTTHTKPIVADSGGFLPAIYLDPAVIYRFLAKTAAGVSISGMEFDPVAVTGASDVTFTQAGAGATTRTVQEKARESVSITDFGGVDDWDGVNGTNNFAAFEAAYALSPVTIRLPRSATGTGTYMVNGVTAVTDASGIVLDPDPEVSVYVQGGSSIPTTFIKGQRSTRLLRTEYSGLRYQDTLSPLMRQNVNEIGRPASALNGQLQIPVKLSFADATHWQLSAWPNGIFSTATPSSVAALTVNWGTPPASSFVASAFDVVPGDYVEALISDLDTYLPAVTVLTDSGWVLVYQNKSGDFSELTKGEKIGVSATVQTSTINATAAQANYRFVKSMVGVVIYDQHNFGLALNGTVIRRYRVDGNIRRAGWAAGFGTSASFIVQSAVLYKNKRTFGIKPLRIVTLGDSTGDETVTGQSQFDFMRQYLAGIGGCQIETLTNLAHSGDTSANQVAALGNIVFAGLGYDFCLIQIGINDIQTNVPVATFVANVLTCINYCRASGVEPIVGIPAMFYSQTSAQAYDQDGGATSHSSDGTSHRLELERMLADNRVYCNRASFEDMGAVVASLLEMKTSAWGDQVVYDNIHPTTWGTMLLGYGWAKAIAAYMTSAAEEDLPSGTVEAIPLPTDIFTGGVGASSTPQYTIDGRTIHVSWYLSRNGVALADGTTVGTLPKRFRPRADVVAQLTNVDASLVPVAAVSATSPPFWTISSAGVIKVYGIAGSPTFMGMSASWKI